MRFLELLKRPDSGRRATPVEVLFDTVAGFGVDSAGSGVEVEPDGPRKDAPSVPKVSSDP
jgi:hypothetical protein